ncbi:hypothetical protein SELSPUOL_02074 [Selenomonas sputigena ATCC 35185]|uniref:Uncharacterized protein n=1 Tax=Selenomonas sputigena (strain ATCC 35185 / DSM 20758 / CCUG 44933 / VPI D19B-28) TaxID=546271 RepID=C9LX71_SELS3|nr:hypothetical protein SELSPUOL_02074 [Selenomonas sputigena ATCC 35185]
MFGLRCKAKFLFMTGDGDVKSPKLHLSTKTGHKNSKNGHKKAKC